MFAPRSLLDISLISLAVEEVEYARVYPASFIVRKRMDNFTRSLGDFIDRFGVDLKNFPTQIAFQSNSKIDVCTTLVNLFTATSVNAKDIFGRMTPEERLFLMERAREDEGGFLEVILTIFIGLPAEYVDPVSFKKAVRKCVEIGATYTLIDLLKSIRSPSARQARMLFDGIPQKTSKEVRQVISWYFDFMSDLERFFSR
ncbi:hypothetical protein QR680_014007 [Steinernema hermaphroditum]|uniref:Uncharacterized protein n=1 Tax=Steinernema hermaphroditum TaxID=289476 RepID=A0AA39I7E5_9BILA|nr:hypothetical protein QR680_014007 [Steinernema hermaphroditum]